MIRGDKMISLEKRYENFKSTIEECGSYLLLEDDDTIKHNLFEEFSIDIISFLHEDIREKYRVKECLFGTRTYS